MSSIQDTDVVIIGAGVAGIAAAVGASNNGTKVVLIEQQTFPGGKATAAEVGTICGLYEFNKDPTSDYIVKGFAWNFAERLKAASQSQPLHNVDGLHYLPYDVHAFQNLCAQLLASHDVDVFYNASLEMAHLDNKQVTGISANVGTINCKAVIDCSGDGVVSRIAGMEVIRDDTYQAAAQVFTIANVAEENEARLGMIIMRALRSAIDDQKLPAHFDRVYIVQGSLKDSQVSLKIGIPVPVTYAEGNMEEIKNAGMEFLLILFSFLHEHVPVFKNSSIDHIAAEPGIRTGSRCLGKYILTREDVLECRKFPDAVANGAWPIEEWDQKRRVSMAYLKPGDHYQVPARCLQSKHIENLFCAGRNISASQAAIASARVMGICLQTGYAAGCLASAKALGIPEYEAIRAIQNQQL